MKINAQSIIDETLAVFEKSGAANIFRNCKNLVKDKDYKQLHPHALTPTSIKIDVDLFNIEINQYNNYFERWGTDHQELERYGLALVNQDGMLKSKDPINGSLMAWNRDNPTQPLLETECVMQTPVMSMESLKSLNILDGHWCRSNILKWHDKAFFYPHIDTVVPSMWIRLWATTSPDIIVRFYNPATGELEQFKDIELGRVYVIDTSIVHDAYATNDNVHQLFLSVLPSAFNVLVSDRAN
jgi:hypothetical protein